MPKPCTVGWLMSPGCSRMACLVFLYRACRAAGHTVSGRGSALEPCCIPAGQHRAQRVDRRALWGGCLQDTVSCAGQQGSTWGTRCQPACAARKWDCAGLMLRRPGVSVTATARHARPRHSLLTASFASMVPEIHCAASAAPGSTCRMLLTGHKQDEAAQAAHAGFDGSLLDHHGLLPVIQAVLALPWEDVGVLHRHVHRLAAAAGVHTRHPAAHRGA